VYNYIGDCSWIGNNLARSGVESLGIAYIYIYYLMQYVGCVIVVAS
jgi:hypothetical protein